MNKQFTRNKNRDPLRAFTLAAALALALVAMPLAAATPAADLPDNQITAVAEVQLDTGQVPQLEAYVVFDKVFLDGATWQVTFAKQAEIDTGTRVAIDISTATTPAMRAAQWRQIDDTSNTSPVSRTTLRV